jgi:hypothetical protein
MRGNYLSLVCGRSFKVAVLFPIRCHWICFELSSSSSHTMALGLTQPLTDISASNLLVTVNVVLSSLILSTMKMLTFLRNIGSNNTHTVPHHKRLHYALDRKIAITSNLLVIAAVVPNSLILFALMLEAILSSVTSVLTCATRRQILVTAVKTKNLT